jgi:raffinose/stachyose/melibiose transport system substrate-binding protein
MLANFHRVYPDIKVEAQFLNAVTLASLLSTQLQAGNAPDVFQTKLGYTNTNSVWRLAPAGRLLDLSKSPWVKRLPIATKETATYKGKVYLWPLSSQPFDVIYNTGLFKSLGLKIPTTFAGVLSMCRTIAAGGKVPFVQGFAAATEANIFARQRATEDVYSHDPKWDTKRSKNQVTFASSPLWREALQSIVDMKNANCFQPGAAGTSPAQQYAAFAQGQAVMSVVASGEVANMKAINPNLTIGWFNLPPVQKPKEAVVPSFAALGLAGNAATSHPDQVRTFINFMARAKQSSLFAKVTSSIAPFDGTKGILPAEMNGLAPFFKVGKTTQSFTDRWPSTAFDEGLVPGVTGLITGQLTIDAVLAKMDQIWAVGG